jgi:hypothetical protein
MIPLWRGKGEGHNSRAKFSPLLLICNVVTSLVHFRRYLKLAYTLEVLKKQMPGHIEAYTGSFCFFWLLCQETN